MRMILVFDAVVIEDFLYPSGTACLLEGDRVQLIVDSNRATVKRDSVLERPEAVWGGVDQDWIWRHLIVECPWDQAVK